MTISPKHLLSLIQEDYTTIVVQFPSNVRGEGDVYGGKHYTYKAPLKMGVKVGDEVVVITPYGTKVVHVIEVHATPEININIEHAPKWIVQKVDRTFVDQMHEQETAFAKVLVEMERRKQRLQLLKDFEEQLPEGDEARKEFQDAISKFKSVSEVLQMGNNKE